MNTEKPLSPTPQEEFFSYAIPATVSMLLSALVVIVDGFFIGHTAGPSGLAAINMTLPIFTLLLGLTIMVGVGSSIEVSHNLGAKNRPEAARRFSGGMLLLIIVTALFCLPLFTSLDSILSFLKAKGDLHSLARQYLGMMRWFYPLMMANIGLSIFLRAAGKPGEAMGLGILGNLLNVGLNALFILGFEWGLQGAALASGLSALPPALLAMSRFLSKKIPLGFSKPRFFRGEIRGVLANGSSEMVGQVSVAITTWLFNRIVLQRLGVNGLAAYTVVGYLICFEGMAITGLATGLGPIVGFHAGAGNGSRIRKVLSIALKSAGIVGIVCWLLVVFFGASIAFSMSGGDRQVFEIAKSTFALFTSAFLVNGINVIAATFLTALRKPGPSAIIAILRGLVLNSFCVLTLPLFLGDLGIWLSFPITEFSVLLISIPLMLHTHQSLPTKPSNASMKKSLTA
ncbi:MAG: MATE family efflux transporter [Spirochaetales bacterium]|nr:MATE family efflux transporter [Spirochaetales bacterium]